VNPTYDLCVIGGGIVGCSTAFYASRLNLTVLLCERDQLASGASGINPGTVAVATKTPGDNVHLALASMREFAWLDEVLEHAFDYTRGGSLVIFENEQEREFAERHASALRASGVDIALVDRGRVREIQPLIDGPVIGALWAPGDVLISSPKLTRALAGAARSAGADIQEETRVDAIHREGDAWHIRFADGSAVSARWIVNAAGVDAPSVARLLGTDHAIEPCKGQTMATSPMREMTPVRVTSARELFRKQGLVVPETSGPQVEIGFTPQADGSLIIGGTREMVGLDDSLDPLVFATMAFRASRLASQLTGAELSRAWCGFRPTTPDGRPLVGTGDVPGYVIAGGHGGDGVALAPITGRYVADLVAAEGRAPAFAAYAKSVGPHPAG
jgi:sarcosine oxidase subunit beta